MNLYESITSNLKEASSNDEKWKEKIEQDFGEYLDSIHSEGYHDWWVYLKAPYIANDMECGTVHESTLKQCYEVLSHGISKDPQIETSEKLKEDEFGAMAAGELEQNRAGYTNGYYDDDREYPEEEKRCAFCEEDYPESQIRDGLCPDCRKMIINDVAKAIKKLEDSGVEIDNLDNDELIEKVSQDIENDEYDYLKNDDYYGADSVIDAAYSIH